MAAKIIETNRTPLKKVKVEGRELTIALSVVKS